MTAQYRQKVLIVEDEPYLRLGYVRIVTQAGYEAMSAATIAEGWKMAAAFRPDLALLDVALGDGSGLELCRTIKADPQLSGTLVLLLSGTQITSDDQADGLDAGADGYLVKPIPQRELVARMKALLRMKDAETRLHSALEELRQSEARFEKVIRYHADAILVVDRQSRIRFANPAAERLFSRRKDELVAREFGLPIGDAERSAELEIHQPDGTALTVEMRTVEIEWDEENAYLASLRDISERKKMEQALHRAKEAAESANIAKTQFLAHISHEIRTPLNGILGYAQLLKRENNLTEYQQHGLDIIRQSGEHLLDVINDILDLSRIEAGKFELSSGEFSLEHSMLALVEMIKMRAEQKGLLLKYHGELEQASFVHGDEKSLRQILINLLGNAMKFTDVGEVALRVRPAERAGYVRFEVADTGIGIPPEKLGLIFAPFERVNNGQSAAEGTGLGLAISRRLVEMMGGSLHVDSRVGEGSQFWFEICLPAVEKLAEAPKIRRIIGCRGTPPLIGIVDDRAEHRDLLKKMLESCGASTVEFSNGRDVCEQIERQIPDLVLMDVIMSGIDGIETTRQMRQRPALSNVPILAVSASAFEQTRQECFRAGCQEFLSKPVMEEQMWEMLPRYVPADWLYEQEPLSAETTLNASPPVMPSREQLSRLYDYALIGDILGVREEIRVLSQQRPECSEFLKQLETMAARFNLVGIRASIEQQAC